MLATEADGLPGELGAADGRPSVGAVDASAKAAATWLVSSEKAKTEHSDLNAASLCSRERTRQLAALTVELRLARRGALFRRGQPAISTNNSTTASRMQRSHVLASPFTEESFESRLFCGVAAKSGKSLEECVSGVLVPAFAAAKR